MNTNVRKVCKACFEKKRIEFQKTNYIDKLKEIQFEIDIDMFLNKNTNKYLIEIPFQHLSKEFNEECGKYFYRNAYDNLNDPAEGIWVILGDVNFEEQTVCGILVNKPITFDIEVGSIVRADFKDIMDIQIME